MLASFTSNTLPILANWAQIIGDVTLPAGVVGLYFKHKCHDCKRVARFTVGPDRVPKCNQHRQT